MPEANLGWSGHGCGGHHCILRSGGDKCVKRGGQGGLGGHPA